MDFFGIGAAFKSMVRMYQCSSRATGRTTSLIESVKDGDRVVFADMQHMKHFQRLVREREVAVDCVVIDPARPHDIFQRGTSQGRTVFDHDFVERFYENQIDIAIATIDECERAASGYGAPHRETRRAAMEIHKFT